jgi:hypothetical protein
MAFKTFAPGVLTASDMNTFLMNQAVITCTSSTRPSSPVEGMTIYETDTDRYLSYTGTAWRVIIDTYNDYTPIVSGSFTLGNGEVVGRYFRVGSMVHVRGALTVGSTTTVSSTAGTSLEIGYPVGLTPKTGPSTSNRNSRIGQAGLVIVRDDSATGLFTGFVIPSPNRMLFSLFNAESTNGGLKSRDVNQDGFFFTWDVNDNIIWSLIYETDQ